MELDKVYSFNLEDINSNNYKETFNFIVYINTNNFYNKVKQTIETFTPQTSTSFTKE